jgi:hypothetical protein
MGQPLRLRPALFQLASSTAPGWQALPLRLFLPRDRTAKACSKSIVVITIGVVTCRSATRRGHDASSFCKHSAQLRNPRFGSWHLRFGAVIPTSSNPALNERPVRARLERRARSRRRNGSRWRQSQSGGADRWVTHRSGLLALKVHCIMLRDGFATHNSREMRRRRGRRIRCLPVSTT